MKYKILVVLVLLLGALSVTRYKKSDSPVEQKEIAVEEEVSKLVKVSEKSRVEQPRSSDKDREYTYYQTSFKTLDDYIKRKGIIERLNKNQVTDAERQYFYKVLEKMTWYQLRAVEVRLSEIEKRVGV